MKKIIYLLLATLMMVCAVECSAQTVSGNKDGHDYVDLGLPSGRLWATYNLGATKPTEYGDYFAWGETTPKEYYEWSTYKWCDGSDESLTKYCIKFICGSKDGLTILLAEDDAATANWGSDWRMPTETECEELRSGCDWKWSKNFNGSGVAGKVGTSKTNGNTIFLPAAGESDGMDLKGFGGSGFYWSSSLTNYSFAVFGLCFNDVDIYRNEYGRCVGYSVRAVVK